MNTAEIKSNLYKLIEQTEDLNILQAITILLKKQFAYEKNSKTDFWDELPDIVKSNIEESIKEADSGKVFSHEEVKQELLEEYNIEL